jgi:hypothetical protein
MITTIIACIIANILTAAIVVGVAYYFYKKNEVSIKETINDVKEKIGNVSSTVQTVTDTINSIKEKLEKLPF